jgi:16S rRNA (adenine1518-N6/adenine1519-N6)-dimethyltransferase
VGAGLGSLTVALARAGARVVAVEVDRTLVPALEAVVRPFRGSVRVSVADMLGEPWDAVLGPEPVRWTLVANLPYNVAVPLVVRALDEEPRIGRMLVMVQQEVGERLAAGPGDPQYGAVSVHVAFHARARVVRHVPPTVFWPRPSVESVLVSIDRRPPPADVDRDALFAVIRESFAQRRKTMRGALRRLGLGAQSATDALEACGVRASARPEEVSLDAFVCVSRQWLARRGRVSGDR